MSRGVLQTACQVAAMLLASASAVNAHAGSCPAAGGAPAALAAVEPRLELRLTDGRTVRLVGLEAAAATPDAPSRADDARETLSSLLRGHALSVAMLTDRTDRWGRLAAWVFEANAATPGGVSTMAIASGLARFLPEPPASPCRAELLVAEDKARTAALGLWRDPYYSVLTVDDRVAFSERAGTNVLVEARLAAVESGPTRTRLRFAAPGQSQHGGRRLSATILPHAMKTFEAQGVDFPSLIGRTLRLRGLLDQRFGPQMELQRPDAVEVLPRAEASPPSRPN